MSLKVNSLSFSYGKQTVLEDTSFELESNKIGILLGPNGAGKSTILKCLGHVLKPKSGTMYLDDVDIETLNSRKRAQMISYVSQSQEDSGLTVFDTILLGRIPYLNFGASKEDYMKTDNIIRELGLGSLSLKPVSSISGGERQKVAIGQALVGNPKLVVLDEPTSNLDIAAQLEIINILNSLKKEHGLTILIAMHDLNLAMSLGEKFFFLIDKKIEISGNRSIINEENIYKAYKVKSKLIENNGAKFVSYI